MSERKSEIPLKDMGQPFMLTGIPPEKNDRQKLGKNTGNWAYLIIPCNLTRLLVI